MIWVAFIICELLSKMYSRHFTLPYMNILEILHHCTHIG